MDATQERDLTPSKARGEDRLDPDAITLGLRTKALGLRVKVFDATASTNSVAAEYARNPDNHGLAVLAEHQTAGRGRGGHRWFSPRGQSLLVSIVLTRWGLAPELLSLAAAVAVAETIGPGARIKWPNDILLSGKKVAGILVETTVFRSHRAAAVGIGINCHQDRTDFPPELRGLATSMDLETGTFVDRNGLARRLFVVLEACLDEAARDSTCVVERWRQVSLQSGQRITVVSDGRRCSGTCLGVDPQHGLILQLDCGGVRMLEASHSHLVADGEDTASREGPTAR
jgi:BirA family biotin operon repressor/biotin-[acetyl-CoA-carboxylase] ligase